MLEFIYTNRMQLDEDLALDLLEVADKYLLKDLKALCEKFLSENIRLENLESFANLAESLDLSILRKGIIAFVPKNLQMILDSQTLYKLPHAYYWNILSEAIPRKKNN